MKTWVNVSERRAIRTHLVLDTDRVGDRVTRSRTRARIRAHRVRKQRRLRSRRRQRRLVFAVDDVADVLALRSIECRLR